MSGLELYVDGIDVTNRDEAIYTVHIHSGDGSAFLPNKYLVPQTPIFKKFSAKGEYGEQYNDTQSRTAMRKFYNFLSNASETQKYAVTSRANDIMRATDNGLPIVEMIRFNEWDPNDISRQNISDMKQKVDDIGLWKSLQEGLISFSYVLAAEQRALNEVIRGIEDQMMWGLGGISGQVSGADDIRTSVGLWRQLDNSFKRVYQIGTFNMGIIESEIYNYYNGRVDFVGPDPKREVIIQTGIAGMKQVNYAIKTMAANSGMVINAAEVGAINNGSGSKNSIPMINGMDLSFGYAYTQYVINFLANVKFVINPALDPVLANEIENPKINGYRLSSYCYIAWDVTANGGNDNIYLVEWNYDKGLNWWYQNGSRSYNGMDKGFMSMGDFSGWNVHMEQYHKGVQVMDPTRILKWVPFNVVTNAPFGS